MSVQVNLAAVLAERAGGRNKLDCTGKNIEQLLKNLTSEYEELGSILWRKSGEFNPMLLVFRNDEDIRGLEGLATTLNDGDRVAIIAALEGGS